MLLATKLHRPAILSQWCLSTQNEVRHIIDLLQKSVFDVALGGVPAAEDGDESIYARSLIEKLSPDVHILLNFV